MELTKQTNELQKFNPKNTIVGWDWVEFTTKAISSEVKTNNKNLQVILSTKLSSANFKQVHEVYTTYKNEHLMVAQIESKPRVSFIDKNIIKFKISNNFLYQHSKDILNLINLLVGSFDVTFLNYTRLDSYIDFQIDEENNPQTLLDLLAKNQLKVQNKHNVKIYRQKNNFNAITFGSRTSETMVTLYNKTLEMQQKQWKHHIELSWKTNNFNHKNETYRLEFSTKKNTNNYINTDTGETINYNNILMINWLDEIIEYNLKTHFRVAKNTNKRFSREQQIKLFETLKKESEIIKIPSEKQQSNNYIKSFIKHLVKEANYYNRIGDKLQYQYINSHISEMVLRHNLTKWYESKVEQFLDEINNEILCKKFYHPLPFQPIMTQSILAI